MKQYILDFTKEFEYPQGAVDALLSVDKALGENSGFIALTEDFYNDDTINIDTETGPLFSLCNEVGANFFTSKLLFYIYLTKKLRQKYEEKGYSNEFWHENMNDLKIKMMECFDVHKVWGIFSTGWFGSVFRMGTFTIGRLCYNVGEYDGRDFTVAGRKITKGDKFVSIHIPSSGKPFDLETRIDSYRKASEFFNIDLFRCETWLLFPQNRNLLKSSSNIVSFMNDFKIVKSGEYENNRIMWRVFGDKYELPPEKLPRDSSLRKSYAEFMCAGNRPGYGVGYFIFDKDKCEIKK